MFNTGMFFCQKILTHILLIHFIMIDLIQTEEKDLVQSSETTAK